MRTDLEATIFKRCPVIFRKKGDVDRVGPIYFGIECRDGWYKLILNLSVSIELIAKKMKIRGIPEDKLPQVNQIKQKFGSLRYYMKTTSPEINSLIERAMAESVKICERCGREGSLTSIDGFVSTLCDDCRKIEFREI